MSLNLLFLSFVVTVISSQEIEKYRVSNNRILDQYDRECIFHGLNVVYKSAPYLPITDHFDANLSFTTKDMELLNSWGLNAIRLGVMWPGVEPVRNYYNITYINEAAQIISTAYNNYNISTLVDCHQDVLSEALCGEGAAVWATEPLIWNLPKPLGPAFNITNKDHIPSKEQCAQYNWPSYYATEAASSAFQRLYENYNGLADQFADYFGKLAFEFEDISGIIGFELMNEPWAGNIYRDPLLMYPGTADRLNLQPFYDLIQPAIYGNDSDRMIFFESVTWTDEFNVSLDDIGFEHVPGGQQYSNKSVFAFHYYSSPNIGEKDKYFSQRTSDGIRLNSTSFVTETGGNLRDGMYDTLDECDKYLLSWLLWEYKPLAGSIDGTCTGCSYGAFYPNGSLNNANIKGYSRTYAQRIAGHTKLMKCRL